MFVWSQLYILATLAYTPGAKGLAQPLPNDITPTSLPFNASGPPESP